MKKIFLVIALILLASSVNAQTVVNPKTIEFVPSSDHDILALDGSNMVTRYELTIFIEGNSTAISTTDIGKPLPVAGMISITNPIWFAGLTPNTKYIAKVSAIGPTGSGISDPSNPFGNVGPPTKPGAPVVKK